MRSARQNRRDSQTDPARDPGFLFRHELLGGCEWWEAGPTDIDCAKRRMKSDQAGPRGSQNHAAARDIEQLAQIVDRVAQLREELNEEETSLAYNLQSCIESFPAVI